jgi:hypothetical protein
MLPDPRALWRGLILMTFVAPPAGADNPVIGEAVLTDFTPDTADFGWYVLNDDVMGGRSEGDFESASDQLLFRGSTNTNGGGFSSIRTSALQLDLSAYAGIRLRIRGDGRRYTWRLTTAARWRGRPVAYWADFDTVDGAWRTVDVPFAGFVPKFRGYRLDGPALDTAEVTGMGLMIYDDRDGPFELRLASVGAYTARAPFRLGDYRWKHRLLVVSATRSDDDQLRAQLQAIQASADEFADRDLVLVTLVDDDRSTAGSQAISADDVARAREALGIPRGEFALRLVGKDGSVKLSSRAATAPEEIYALIDTMPMRRREQSEP